MLRSRGVCSGPEVPRRRTGRVVVTLANVVDEHDLYELHHHLELHHVDHHPLDDDHNVDFNHNDDHDHPSGQLRIRGFVQH